VDALKSTIRASSPGPVGLTTRSNEIYCYIDSMLKAILVSRDSKYERRKQDPVLHKGNLKSVRVNGTNRFRVRLRF